MLLLTQTVLAVIAMTCTAAFVSKDMINVNIDGNLELGLDETNHIVSDPISSSESDDGIELLSSDTYKSEADEPNTENTDELNHQDCGSAQPSTGKNSISLQNFGIGTVLKFIYTSPGPIAVTLNVLSSSGDILLHFNPRPYVTGPVLVLNSFLGCGWGAEERPSGYTFFSGTVYVVIAVEESGYRITANGGVFQYLYKHRRTLTSDLVISINTDLDYVQCCYTGHALSVDNSTCSECLPNEGMGPCAQICTNTPGSFYCSCQSGFTTSGYNCTDIDECMTGTSNCSQICVNTIGSYICSCMTGYMLSSDNRTCNDIDECITGNNSCSQICNNTIGSYFCSCYTGYALLVDNSTCTDINECLPNGGMGPCAQICTNTPGSFHCSCQSGFTTSGYNCTDIDECMTGTDNCSQICFNTIGSYICSCMTGYMLSSDNRTCNAQPSRGKKNISLQNFGIGTVLRFIYPSPGPIAGTLNVLSSSGDILLHFNPRPYVSGPVLVLNSFLGCGWGTEERPSGYPFFSGTVYVVIAVEESGYRITANGGVFQYLYKHRRTLTSDLVISINTDLDYVQYGAVVSSKGCKEENIGKVIYVNGATPASSACGAGVCAINLYHAPPSLLAVSLPSASSPDFALHFNPRFYLNYVVRNTFTNGGWGPEEIAGGMPFTPNAAFKVAIFLQQEQYETAVNGDHFISYKYRLPLTSPVTVLVEPSLLGSSAKVQVV